MTTNNHQIRIRFTYGESFLVNTAKHTHKNKTDGTFHSLSSFSPRPSFLKTFAAPGNPNLCPMGDSESSSLRIQCSCCRKLIFFKPFLSFLYFYLQLCVWKLFFTPPCPLSVCFHFFALVSLGFLEGGIPEVKALKNFEIFLVPELLTMEAFSVPDQDPNFSVNYFGETWNHNGSQPL